MFYEESRNIVFYEESENVVFYEESRNFMFYEESHNFMFYEESRHFMFYEESRHFMFCEESHHFIFYEKSYHFMFYVKCCYLSLLSLLSLYSDEMFSAQVRCSSTSRLPTPCLALAMSPPAQQPRQESTHSQSTVCIFTSFTNVHS